MGIPDVRRAASPVLAVALCGLLAAGCSASTEADPSAPPSASGEPSASVSIAASPASTLSPEEQQAFEEATAVALAYRQTIADLYSGARTDLNDLDKVATGELLDRGLRNLQQGLDQGYRSEPLGVQLALVSAEPVSVALADDPPIVVLRACIDASALTALAPDGSRTPGNREELTYRIARASASSGWLVAETSGSPDAEERAC